MAKHEQDRENLLREATALVARVELTLPHRTEPIVVGFRTGGAASVYCGADPVYHFTTTGKLRRAYIDGVLYKADAGRLVGLQRQRGEGEVRLVTRQPTESDHARRIQDLVTLLSELCTSLRQGSYHLVGQVPENEKLIERVESWTGAMNEIHVADTPGLK